MVTVVTQYSEQLTPDEIIKLFDSHKSWDGLYYYLGAIVNTSDSPTVHFKYIQAAAELKQYREVERVCRDSTVYDPNEVKQYLKEAKLPDPRPLIHVCDRCVSTERTGPGIAYSCVRLRAHVCMLSTAAVSEGQWTAGVLLCAPRLKSAPWFPCAACRFVLFSLRRHDMVDELTSYLVANNLLKFVEVYVQRVSPQKTPAVVGKLLDLDCDEDFIKRLLDSVRNQCPVDPLVEQVETRNRLRMLQPWLEQRITEGNTEAATHNAIGKIYITINKEPQTFLKCVLLSMFAPSPSHTFPTRVPPGGTHTQIHTRTRTHHAHRALHCPVVCSPPPPLSPPMLSAGTTSSTTPT